jgi:hypothetical protein
METRNTFMNKLFCSTEYPVVGTRTFNNTNTVAPVQLSACKSPDIDICVDISGEFSPLFTLSSQVWEVKHPQMYNIGCSPYELLRTKLAEAKFFSDV